MFDTILVVATTAGFIAPNVPKCPSQHNVKYWIYRPDPCSFFQRAVNGTPAREITYQSPSDGVSVDDVDPPSEFARAESTPSPRQARFLNSIIDTGCIVMRLCGQT